MLSHKFQLEDTDPDIHCSAGVGCYSWGPGSDTYVFFVNLQNEVVILWKDLNTTITRYGDPYFITSSLLRQLSGGIRVVCVQANYLFRYSVPYSASLPLAALYF